MEYRHFLVDVPANDHGISMVDQVKLLAGRVSVRIKECF